MKNKLIIVIVLSFLLTNSLFAQQFKVGVNKFAWYSALQTINFMPLLTADPFGGVILTDWYAMNNTEKYKIDIYINEGLLTANTVTVKVFKQIKNNNIWQDTTADAQLSEKIENSILNLARQLRMENSLTQ